LPISKEKFIYILILGILKMLTADPSWINIDILEIWEKIRINAYLHLKGLKHFGWVLN